MYLDIKTTVWERVHFNSENEMNQVINALKNGELINGNDVCNHLNKGTEVLQDTSEEITVVENDGCSTMEIFNGNHEMIWDNVEGDCKL